MPRSAHEWTPARGVIGALSGGVATLVVMGAPAAVLAWYLPSWALQVWLRLAAASATVWVGYMIVHRMAGMTGPLCTSVVVAVVIAIILVQHVIFAIHGVPTKSGMMVGWAFLSPTVLGVMNGIPSIGIAFGVWLWHDGASVSSLASILNSRIR